MRKLLIALALLAPQSRAAISILQSSVTSVVASGANFTLTSKTLTSGSTVIVALALGSDIGGSGGVTDSGGVNTYSASVAKEDHTYSRIRSFVANNVTAISSGTITYACASACPGGMIMYLVEIGQVDTGASPAGTSTGTKEGAGALTTGAFSPSGSAAIVALGHDYYGSGTLVASSGWTDGGTASAADSIGRGSIATRIVTAGTFTPSFDATGTAYCTAVSLYFTEGGAAPPAGNRKRVVVIQ